MGAETWIVRLVASIAGAIGNIHRRQGRIDDAILAYERRLEIDPEHALGLNTLAETYHSVGRHADARALADRLVELGDPRGPVQRFWSSFHTGDTARAWEQIPTIQEAQGRPGQPGYFAFLQAYARDDIAGANALIDQIGTDDTAVALRTLMAVHLGTTGQAGTHAAAFDAWIDSIKVDLVEDPTTNLGRAVQAERHSDLALLEALRGNRDEAMAHIATVERIDPLSIDAWRTGPTVDLSLANAVLGETDAAVAGIQDLVDRRLGWTTGWLAFEPSLDGLRDDPRFQAIVAQRAAMEQPAM
jgi:tetratricopeptide (TPR) repeat protein